MKQEFYNRFSLVEGFEVGKFYTIEKSIQMTRNSLLKTLNGKERTMKRVWRKLVECKVLRLHPETNAMTVLYSGWLTHRRSMLNTLHYDPDMKSPKRIFSMKDDFRLAGKAAYLGKEVHTHVYKSDMDAHSSWWSGWNHLYRIVGGGTPLLSWNAKGSRDDE